MKTPYMIMTEAMNELDECLSCWIDLPHYMYTEEYRRAFYEFVKKKIVEGEEIPSVLAIRTVYNETKGTPLFEFDRRD